MATRGSLIVLLLLLLIGCRPATPPPTTTDPAQVTSEPGGGETSSPATPTSVSDQVEEIRNAQYQPGTAEGSQLVQLTDGKFEQGTPGSEDFISVQVTDFVAIGDLDADGTEEAAALISENYGGTGVFVFLAVFSQVDGTWTFQTSSMVDDRPELRKLSIANNEIFLDAVIHGADEPMCCPTLRTMRHYRFVDNLLDMIDYTTFTPDGQPRTITIESPANGAEVFTTVPIKGKVAIAPFENNLVYRIVDLSGIELSAGPIAVTAPDLGAPGTFDAVIPLGNNLSGAIIRLEVQDVSAADGSLLGMDSVELVVK
ncbi:MAG TPA: Gmad2 immunoglobulin-like domain-containing protein [Anaerolineales bacterium]|nr:Gmad2 immunoglobulin-like domain-containing protein [Anaerolineales bacterium]